MHHTLADRIQVSFAPVTRKWLEENFHEQGYSAVSKYVSFIVDEYVKTKVVPLDPEPEGPVTPDQEVDKLVEEMGRLSQQHHEKFEAMHSLIPKDAPGVLTLEDLTKTMALIWAKVKEKNGIVRTDRKKVMAISKADLRCYDLFCQLRLRKQELERMMGTATVALS